MYPLSVWEEESFFAPQDVIIVGSGFAGLWSAVKLKEKNPALKITIAERGWIPTGASTRNAGFSCFGSPSELLNDMALMGEAKTFELVHLRYRGLQQIRQYLDDHTSGFDASGGYECFMQDSADWKLTDEKLDWLNEKMKIITGETNTFIRADEELAALGLHGFDHLVKNTLEGGLHSGKIVQALLAKIQGMGVQVLTNTTVQSFVRNNSIIEVHSNLPAVLKTKQLLLCTNAFTKALVPEADIIPNRGQVLITDEIPGLQLRGTFHFDKGYYYFRNLGNRILLGGARNKAFDEEETTDIAVTDIIQNELERFISVHLLPNASFHITNRWSGIMAMGSEKLPIVKAVDDHIFCCVRMSGMGVALAPVVAEQVANLMLQ